MADLETKFHETWLGMVQPVDGLVVSVPVLVDGQCMHRLPPSAQDKLVELAPPLESGRHRMRAAKSSPSPSDATTESSRAGEPYAMLVWELPPGLPLDKLEKATGPWEYPPSAKFDRLLRACRVPIGLLTNLDAVRLVYAPHGESSGAITFRVEDMATAGGRPILDAFVMLLSAQRFFGVSEERTLPALLRASRQRQADVTNTLAEQVFEALEVLLRGFEAAAERDRTGALEEALARGDDHVYGGLLTVLLRLVFLLYAEDQGLMPVDDEDYSEHLSISPCSRACRRTTASTPTPCPGGSARGRGCSRCSGRCSSGCATANWTCPPGAEISSTRSGTPSWKAGPRAAARPSTSRRSARRCACRRSDDETVFRVLEKLLLLEGQRLSYRALDVEQIGSVYEALMGFHVARLPGTGVCVRPARVWVSASEVLELLAGLRASRTELLPAGRLVMQPGEERRRTSSHYTPRSLSAPIVRKTLEPLIATMGQEPSSERLLNLKICDPAMGSGAFLVEACRYLADRVVAAWTREGQLNRIASVHEDVVTQARRLVAQRCLYGIDKNAFAVSLAKLSLWLVTLAKNERSRSWTTACATATRATPASSRSSPRVESSTTRRGC